MSWRDDAPFTHEQYMDTDGADMKECRPGKHDWIEVGDDGIVCSRCGVSDIEFEW